MSKNNSKRELTWVGKLRQWRKRKMINGKRRDYYLGKGDGPNDIVSYRRALAKWREIEAKLQADAEEQRLREQLQELDITRRLAGSPEHRINVESNIHDLEQGMSRQQAQHRAELKGKAQTAMAADDWEVAASTATAVAETGTNGKLTFGVLIDLYLEEQRRRYEHGQAVPNAPRRDRISGQRLMGYRYQCSHIRQAWGDLPVPEDEAALTHLITEFRKYHQQRIVTGEVSGHTFNDRMASMRHFLGWASRTYDPRQGGYYLPQLPRNISELCSKYHVEANAQALDLDTIHTVWNAAYLPLKTYIALGLNCGYYAVDVAHLRRGDIKDGYLTTDRRKTGVPCRYKLWPVTQQLLDRTMNGEDDFAFEARRGGRLLQVNPDGRPRRWCEIENDLAACRKRAKVKGVSFSMFRDTSSTHIEAIDRSVTDLFDAHADRRMARYYIDGERLDLDRMYRRLDEAIDELDGIYSLSC